jgi:hypothetical protein
MWTTIISSLLGIGGGIATQVGNANTAKINQGIAEDQQTTAYIGAMAQINAADAAKAQQKTKVITITAISLVVVAIAVLIILTRKK